MNIKTDLSKIHALHPAFNSDLASKVLVVDDEKSIRLSLQAFLVGEGHDVKVAEHAWEAIQLIEDHEFDVVVSDIMLPDIRSSLFLP